MQHLLKGALVASALALSLGLAHGQDLTPLNSDSEPDRMDGSELDAKFGALPAPAAGTKVGGVSKTLTNEFWRPLGDGDANVAGKLGIKVVDQAAQNEGDQMGRLSIAENLNGALIAWGGLQPLIVTLGGLSLYRALALIFSGGTPIFGLQHGFRALTNGNLAGVPNPVVAVAVLVVLAWWGARIDPRHPDRLHHPRHPAQWPDPDECAGVLSVACHRHYHHCRHADRQGD